MFSTELRPDGQGNWVVRLYGRLSANGTVLGEFDAGCTGMRTYNPRFLPPREEIVSAGSFGGQGVRVYCGYIGGRGAVWTNSRSRRERDRIRTSAQGPGSKSMSLAIDPASSSGNPVSPRDDYPATRATPDLGLPPWMPARPSDSDRTALWRTATQSLRGTTPGLISPRGPGPG